MTKYEMRILTLEQIRNRYLYKAECYKRAIDKTINPFKRRKFRKCLNDYLVLAEAYDDVISSFKEFPNL